MADDHFVPWSGPVPPDVAAWIEEVSKRVAAACALPAGVLRPVAPPVLRLVPMTDPARQLEAAPVKLEDDPPLARRDGYGESPLARVLPFLRHLHRLEDADALVNEARDRALGGDLEPDDAA